MQVMLWGLNQAERIALFFSSDSFLAIDLAPRSMYCVHCRQVGEHPGVAVPVSDLPRPVHLASQSQLRSHLLLALLGSVAQVGSNVCSLLSYYIALN